LAEYALQTSPGANTRDFPFVRKELPIMGWNRRNGIAFTEVLLIVIIMAVVVATVIPLFRAPAREAEADALGFDLYTIRRQIEAYKTQHQGKIPLLATFAAQMTMATDLEGRTAGPHRTCGPYLQSPFPANPFNGGNTVVSVAIPGQEPTAIVPGGAGWQYDPTTGGFYPNNAEAYPAP
jgi:general secretion pathway protein G